MEVPILGKNVVTLTTHLFSIEHADWLKLHDMFKARDAKSWQRQDFRLEFVP